MLPTVVVDAVLDDQVPSAQAWADRHGWALHFDRPSRTLTVQTVHPKTNDPLTFRADLDDYNRLPPMWSCRAGGQGARLWPSPGNRANVSGSIWHPNKLICAPWNRLAFADHGGPHGDWTLTNWQEVTGYTLADTLADMLDQLRLHLAASPGLTP